MALAVLVPKKQLLRVRGFVAYRLPPNTPLLPDDDLEAVLLASGKRPAHGFRKEVLDLLVVRQLLCELLPLPYRAASIINRFQVASSGILYSPSTFFRAINLGGPWVELS